MSASFQTTCMFWYYSPVILLKYVVICRLGGRGKGSYGNGPLFSWYAENPEPFGLYIAIRLQNGIIFSLFRIFHDSVYGWGDDPPVAKYGFGLSPPLVRLRDVEYSSFAETLCTTIKKGRVKASPTPHPTPYQPQSRPPYPLSLRGPSSSHQTRYSLWIFILNIYIKNTNIFIATGR